MVQLVAEATEQDRERMEETLQVVSKKKKRQLADTITDEENEDFAKSVKKQKKKRKKDLQLVLNESEPTEIETVLSEITEAETPEDTEAASGTVEETEHLTASRVKKRKKKKKRQLDDATSNGAKPAEINTLSPETTDPVISLPENTEVKKLKKKKKRELDEATSNGAEPAEINTLPPESTDPFISLPENTEVKKHKKKKKKREESILDETEAVEHNDDQTELNAVPPDMTDTSLEARKVVKKDERNGETLKEQGEFEIDGMTLLPDRSKTKMPQVKRQLPEWISKPSTFVAHLSNQQPLETIPWLDPFMLENLKQLGITHLFPVQMSVIPTILSRIAPGTTLPRDGLPPRDICCSAPTGCGKTLAFAIPIVQTLSSTIQRHIRALVIAPVAELAEQILQVFKACCTGTRLKVGMAFGLVSRNKEETSLICRQESGLYQSNVDILIATPMRLTEHLSHSDGFDLSHVRFLVLDEVDRMLIDSMDWMRHVESAIYSKRGHPKPLTAYHAKISGMPLQKLLFSATLTDDAEKLNQVSLNQPHLITPLTCGAGTTVTVNGEKTDGNRVKSRQFDTPEGLKECITLLENPIQKPLLLLHMIFVQKLQNVLIFCNSFHKVKRLYLLISKFKGDREVRVDFMSQKKNVDKKKRSRVVKRFSQGHLDVLVTTDLMARGLDLANIEHVILYETPATVEGYVHRVGRTSRAGRPGQAHTLILQAEAEKFCNTLKNVGRTVEPSHVEAEKLEPLRDACQTALKEVGAALE